MKKGKLQMKDVYVFGTSSGLARVIAEYLLDDSGYRFLGFLLNAEYCNTKKIANHPLLAFESVAKSGGSFSIINCIGYSEMLDSREKVSHMIKSANIPLESYIHKSAIIMSNTEIGDNNIIMAGVYIGNRVIIGGGNIFAPCSHTETNGLVGNYNFFAPQSVRLGSVRVNNHCIFGGNSTIKNDITIASYTLIGAGAYITTDTKENGVYVNPRTKRVSSVNSSDFIHYMKQ